MKMFEYLATGRAIIASDLPVFHEVLNENNAVFCPPDKVTAWVGALQALLTPDLGLYGFPHFRFFQTYISHGLIISAAIYMTVVEGFRPTWKSLLRVALWINVYMAVVFGINLLIGSNYLFVAHKPPTASLLDLLPAWPWYILWMEAIGLVMCLILYLPFAIKDWRAKARAK